jgi:hypothetical protein
MHMLLVRTVSVADRSGSGETGEYRRTKKIKPLVVPSVEGRQGR